jgi:hypothetical protein
MTSFAKFLICMGLLCVAGCGIVAHEAAEADRNERQRERDWLAFSITHHCKILKRDGFWDTSTLWECDGGFQVDRRP